MQHCQLKVPNKLGLHARAAMKLSDLAARYQCAISLTHNERMLDVKDIMKLMTLGASQGMLLEFSCAGSDEQEALHAIENLFARNFDEVD